MIAARANGLTLFFVMYKQEASIPARPMAIDMILSYFQDSICEDEWANTEELVAMFVGQKPKMIERLRLAREEQKHWHDNSTDLLDFQLVPSIIVMRKQNCQGKLPQPAEGMFEFVHYGNREKTIVVL